MNPTTSLIAAACAGAAIAALAAWGLTRRWYGTRLQLLQTRYAQLHATAIRYEKETRQKLSLLEAELAVERARSRSAGDVREQLARRAALEAVLVEEASKPRGDDTVFPDTEPLAPWMR